MVKLKCKFFVFWKCHSSLLRLQLLVWLFFCLGSIAEEKKILRPIRVLLLQMRQSQIWPCQRALRGGIKSAIHKKISKLAFFTLLTVLLSVFFFFCYCFSNFPLLSVTISFANNLRNGYTCSLCSETRVINMMTLYVHSTLALFICGKHISHMDLVNWATKTMLNDPLCRREKS